MKFITIIFIFSFIFSCNIISAQENIFSGFTNIRLLDAGQPVTFISGTFSTFHVMCFLGSVDGITKVYMISQENLYNGTTFNIINSAVIDSSTVPGVQDLTITSLNVARPDSCVVSTPTNLIFVVFNMQGTPIYLPRSYPFSFSSDQHPNQVVKYIQTAYYNVDLLVITGYNAQDDQIVLYLFIINYLDNNYSVTQHLSENLWVGSEIINSIYDENYSTLIIGSSHYTCTSNVIRWYMGNGFPFVGPIPSNVITRYTVAMDSIRIYSCTLKSDGLYLEAIDSNSLLVDTYFLLGDTYINCRSGVYIVQQQQLFLFATTTDNTLEIIYIGTQGQTPIYSSFPASISVPVDSSLISFPSSVPSFETFRSVMIGIPANGNQNGFLTFNFTSLCDNDCSGPEAGACVASNAAPYHMCQCEEYYYGDTCETSLGEIYEDIPVNAPYFGGRITLTGNDFSNNTLYSILIDDSECTDPIFISKTQISCIFHEDESFDPFDSVDWQVTLVVQDEYRSGGIYSFFASPNVTQTLQIDSEIVIVTKNLIPLDALVITLDGDLLTDCDIYNDQDGTPTGISCILPSSSSNGALHIATINDDVLYNEIYLLQPYLTSYTPSTPLPTLSSTITIIGDYFEEAFEDRTLRVLMGNHFIDIETPPTSNSFIITIPDGIPLNKSISIVNEDDVIISNLISLVYRGPEINGAITQLSSNHDNFEIYGSNFGYLNELVVINVTNDGGTYSTTILSTDQHTITFKVPATGETGSLSVIIDGQQIGPVIFILKPIIKSVSPLPSIVGDQGITISGEFLRGSVISIDRNPLNCTFSTSNYPGEAYCDFPSGSGSFELFTESLFMGDSVNSTFSTSYHPPTITDISPKSYRKGEPVTFTITGNNFAELNLAIEIGGEECDVSFDNLTQIICDLTSQIDPSTITNPILISVSVDSLEGQNSEILIYEKQCPDNCSSHGSCNLSMGQCVCEANYSGDNCSNYEEVVSTSSLLIINSISIVMLIFINFLFI